MKKPRQAIFETYPDKGREWRWRLKDVNGEVVAHGGPYGSESGVRHAIMALRGSVSMARVEEVEK